MPERIPNGVAKLVVFRAIASSDHFTPATAKTIAITISKNGATSFSNPNAGATNATEMASGFYKFTLDTTDTGTNGPLAWRAAGTGIDDVGDVYEVVNATNAGFTALPNVASGSAGAVVTSGTGTAQLSVSSGLVTLAGVTHTGAVIPTVTTTTTATNVTTVNGLAGGVITAASIAADAITAAKVAADVSAEIADAVWDEARAGHVGAGSFGEGVASVQGNVTGSAASVTGAVGSVTGAVGSVTGNVGGNVTGSVGSVAAGGITAASIATGAIDADALAADAGTEIAAAVWGADATSYQTQGTFGQAIGDPAADSDSIWAIVNAHGATGAGLTAVPWNAAWDAEVQSEVQDAIEVNHLDHLLAVDYDPAAKPGTATALLNELVESDAGVSRFTANALEQAPSGTGASAATIADAVWDEVLADHLTAGSTGAGLNAAGSAGDPWSTALPGAYGAGTAGKIIGDNINATISSRLASASYTAPLDAAGTRTAVGLASANLDTQLGAIDDFLDTEVAAIKAKTDNLPAAPAATGDIPSAATIADAVWDEATAGHASAGSAGKALTDVLDDTGTAGVVVASLAANSVTAAALAADAVTEIQNGLSTLTAAQVNAEVVDALATDTYAEPGQGAPAATASLAAKIGHVYKISRNKITQDASTFKIYADDGTTVDAKATVADDGVTFSRSELASGP